MIPQTFDEAYERVKHLASIFRQNEKQYLSSAYSEAQARLDFIDKFWIALGWDVNHETQTNPYEQEVKVERGVAMSAGRKRADYAFLASNFRDVLFYVEAKKPQGELDTLDNYFQTIRYGWSNQTPLAVLTDFEHLRILDCRYRPDIETSINRAVKKFHYSEYAYEEKFREIYYLFSREAALTGSLEKYSASLPKPKRKKDQRTVLSGGIQSIDELFLQELDGYREELARSFKNKNPHLNSEELTEVTQRTLDRLVFMRFLEDKLIEPEPLVKNLGVKGTAWQDFVATSHRLDGIYNGIIFKKHSLLDAPDFQVDERTFTGIRDKFAHTNSPYDFNAIPIHILGSIYERFLGKVIVATDKRARVEEKPEVRKAGGVYYTPQYIVTYIVENTVGKLIEGKTPEEVSKLRFADIACGSGSFLLGVYDRLLRHHTAYFNEKKNHTRALKAGCVQRDDGALHLSLRQKKDILLNNIYGVDLDSQAVEVAQLSLFLKLLEDETTSTAKSHQLEFRETMLPTLDKNVIHGNALIGWDVLHGQLFDEERRNLFPLDFEDKFKDIMRGGGFDAIVGNPPYVRIQGFPRDQIKYFSDHYKSAVKNFDLYVTFVERGHQLLRSMGQLGFILPNKFFRTDYGEGLRNFIAENKALARVVDFGASQVFEATTYTCLLFLSKEENTSFFYTQSDASSESLLSAKYEMKSGTILDQDTWAFSSQVTSELLTKIRRNSKRLLNLPADMSRGSSTGDDKIFMFAENEIDIEDEILRTPIFATDFGRYVFKPRGEWQLIFPYVVEEDSYRLYSEEELKNKCPKAFSYLHDNKNKLEMRKQFQKWYGYSAPRNLPLHDRAQIFVPLLANRGLFALIPKETQGQLSLMASGGFSISLQDDCPLDARYVLGVLNSRLIFWTLRQLSNIFRGGWITCTKQYFGELPIRTIEFSDKADKGRHDKMVNLVEQMIAAKPKCSSARSDQDRTYYENMCAALDRQIDALVYELYGLTNEEIAIVEAD